jgi:hypothetical protein
MVLTAPVTVSGGCSRISPARVGLHGDAALAVGPMREPKHCFEHADFVA